MSHASHQRPSACIVSPAVTREQSSSPLRLDVGLVNNMPDSALKRTERQFLDLLSVAAGDQLRICLHYFSMNEIPRGQESVLHMHGLYADASRIIGLELDGLVVTGNEPRTASIRDELHWRSLTRLVDAGVEHGLPTIWSCLAAHAAVLHLDGVERRPVGYKRFGLFECEAVAVHPLLQNVPSTLVTPHSRYNEVRENDLLSANYHVLTRSREAGVDAFVKDVGTCDFIFFQGHPEYDARALLGEYRRDALRFLSGASDVYPSVPRNYIDIELEDRLSRLAQRAKVDRTESLAVEILEVTRAATPANRWRNGAVAIYRNWLSHLADRKLSRPHVAVSLEAAKVNALQPS